MITGGEFAPGRVEILLPLRAKRECIGAIAETLAADEER
jgi:hypothetical protein